MTEQPPEAEHIEPPVIESEEDYGLSAELIHGIEGALEVDGLRRAASLPIAGDVRQDTKLDLAVVGDEKKLPLGGAKGLADPQP